MDYVLVASDLSRAGNSWRFDLNLSTSEFTDIKLKIFIPTPHAN